MYKCKFFKINELVPVELLKYQESVLWGLFDDRLLKAIDFLRDIYGSIIINDERLGLNECGFRLKPIGTAIFSQHLFGRAFDCHIKFIEDKNLPKTEKIKEYNNVRNYLRTLEFFNDFRFEDNVSWLHIDRGNFINKDF